MKKSSKKLTTIFRPTATHKGQMLREFREGNRGQYNSFHPRYNYPFKHVNEKNIGRIFQHLHYLAEHAPEAVNKKWNKAYNNFMNKYFAEKGKHSVDFANNHTCHRFL